MQRDPGSDDGGVSRAQPEDAKDENEAWRNDAIRRFWILTAERSEMYNLKRSELQAVLAEVTAVTDRVTNQLNTLTRFAVTDYIAEEDDTSAAGDMFLREQMDVMVQSLLTVIVMVVSPKTSTVCVMFTILGNPAGMRVGRERQRQLCRDTRGPQRRLW